MDIDLKGKMPQANTLEEANKIIKALWDVIQKLNERLKTNSRNSSLAPSNDRLSKNKSNVKRTEERKKNPKKRGGQPGHKKHNRLLLSLDKINRVVPCCPNSACACGGQVILNPEYRRHQQHEFPIIRPIVTEYQIYSGSCNQCYQKQMGALPDGVSWSRLGPRATAMTANLSGAYRVSKQNIVNLYRDIFDFNLSIGMICKAEKTVSRALSEPVNPAKHFVRSRDQLGVNSDETGFKEKGKSMWAWIAASSSVAVFMIRGSRNKKVAKELLGKNFKGIVCSDRYSAYQWVHNENRQICLAHLERDFRKISERAGLSSTIGADLLTQTNHLFHFWHQFKDDHINRGILKKKSKPIKIFIEGLLQKGIRNHHSKSKGQALRVSLVKPVAYLSLSYWTDWFDRSTIPDVD